MTMNLNDHDTYILAAQRTPIGAFLGALCTLTAPELGSIAISSALAAAKLSADAVDEVFLGNVLSAGIGQAPARQASLGAKLPASVPTTTVSKVCGSGLQAVILGHRTLKTGDAHIVVTGGMESMSNAPHYLKARGGLRLGNADLIDGMIHDGLWDPYNNFHMGKLGELCAKEYDCSRDAQDEFARESYRRALAAQTSGAFASEIAPVSIAQRKGDPLIVSVDEEPGRGQLDKFASLRPAFDKDGTITAANASSINDGAAAVILASGAAVKAHGLSPIARIVATGAGAQAPEWFTTAPAKAIETTLKRAQMTAADIGLWEINEAFSCVTMACSKLAGVDSARVNVNGGAVALGHPIGASGARILTTLIHAMLKRDVQHGLATLCIGGGEAVATLVERV
jgi:acetyl-CoA C-acetyltransferase